MLTAGQEQDGGHGMSEVGDHFLWRDTNTHKHVKHTDKMYWNDTMVIQEYLD